MWVGEWKGKEQKWLENGVKVGQHGGLQKR